MNAAKKIALGVGCGLPMICAIGGLAAIGAATARSAKSRTAEEAAARREGLPLVPADLASKTRLAPADNSAVLYRAAITELRTPKYKKAFETLSRTSVPQVINGKMPDGFEAALADLAPLLDQFRAATKRPGCDWERPWEKGASVLFPEYSELKHAASLITCEAILKSRRGDWRGALDDIDVARRISDDCGRDPVLISMLVRVAVESTVLRGMDEIVRQNATNVACLDRAKDVLGRFDALPSMKFALGGEIIMARVEIPHIEGRSSFQTEMDENGGYAPKKPSPVERAVYQSSYAQNLFQSEALRVYREMFRNLPDNPEDWQGAVSAMQKVDTEVQNDKSFGNSINQILFPVFTESPVAIARILASRRMTAMAIQLERTHATRGAFPTSLPDLGKTSIDPFSGEPFRYRRDKEGGYILYSVGRDGKDNGGQERETGSTKQEYDEVVHIR